jgi:hypothetical protein
MADAWVNGHRYSGTGESYMRFDPLTVPVRPDGYVRVAIDTGSSFYDGFDTTFDTAIRWTAAGTSPSVTSGKLSVSAGTTALATSVATSQPTFQLLGNMFVNAFSVQTVDAGAKTGAYRFFGLGNAQASPTVAAPIIDGAGFEWIDTTGALSCVIWAAGVRTAVPFTSGSAIAAITAAALADGLAHRYGIYYKTSRVYFEIDTVVVATIAEPSLSTSTLPALALTVNGAATVSPAAINSYSFIGVGDTASNSTSVSDALYPFRKQQITKDGAAAVSIGGAQTVAVAAAGSANVKAAAGRLGRVLITVAGTASITFYDNAAGNSTGTIIGITPATTAVGTVYDFNLPAAAGISAVGGAGSPGVTIGFS